MAFIKSGSTILSFAEYQDVIDIDQRLFEENEGLTDEVVENHLIRSTERILSQLTNTSWYRELALRNGASALTIPTVDAQKIKSRLNDFTDLCVFFALSEYIYPLIADFGNEQNAEFVKIGFYREKFTAIWSELLLNGDWYDYNDNGTVATTEVLSQPTNYQRIR